MNSGLGGLTVLRATHQAVPEAAVLFIADDAGFPYGSKCAGVLSSRLVEIVQKEIDDFARHQIVCSVTLPATQPPPLASAR